MADKSQTEGLKRAADAVHKTRRQFFPRGPVGLSKEDTAYAAAVLESIEPHQRLPHGLIAVEASALDLEDSK